MHAIAEQKKKSNIVEYLLFIWQMEDLMRSVGFDLNILEERLLADLSVEDQIRNKAWFKDLIQKMNSAGIDVTGHLPETYEILNELQFLEKSLLTVIKDDSFIALRETTLPLLAEFRQKLDSTPRSDIEVALTAMYGTLTLKLAKKEISPETRAAIEKFKSYLKALSRAYHEMKSGKLPINN